MNQDNPIKRLKEMYRQAQSQRKEDEEQCLDETKSIKTRSSHHKTKIIQKQKQQSMENIVRKKRNIKQDPEKELIIPIKELES